MCRMCTCSVLLISSTCTLHILHTEAARGFTDSFKEHFKDNTVVPYLPPLLYHTCHHCCTIPATTVVLYLPPLLYHTCHHCCTIPATTVVPYLPPLLYHTCHHSGSSLLTMQRMSPLSNLSPASGQGRHLSWVGS